MPVIVDPAAFATWLDPKTGVRTAQTLLVPAPDDLLRAYPVSLRVNSPRNEGLDLIAPLEAGAEEKPAPGLLL
jgi:putative SOS response-associated peptidase YedK